jgi:hydroxymethylpyrimidine pyrophosphatase-like HAD family hydrolase
VPKVLYADLDGTLVGPGGSLFAAGDGGTSDRAAVALLSLRDAGVELVVMSGRTRRGLHEVARVLGAAAYIAELGAFVVLESGEILENRGSYQGGSRVIDAIVRSGAGALLLERFRGRLEPVAPWTESSLMFQGFVDPEEAEAFLLDAGFGWLAFNDNGRLRRTIPSLDVPEVRAYHLLPRGVSKATSVRLHRRHAGLGVEEAAAVGDSRADLEVAREVGRFFLVANGRASLGGEALPANAVVTEGSYGSGFAEAVAALLGR